VMLESIVAISGRTTLPKAVRFALGLAPGDRVRYTILVGEVRLLKARGLAGILARPGQQSESIEDMEAAVVLGAIEQAGPTR
jgi:antitoxin PrlF